MMSINPEIPRGELRYITNSVAERATLILEAQIATDPDTANAELAFTLAVKQRWEQALINDLNADMNDL